MYERGLEKTYSMMLIPLEEEIVNARLKFFSTIGPKISPMTIVAGGIVFFLKSTPKIPNATASTISNALLFMLYAPKKQKANTTGTI